MLSKEYEATAQTFRRLARDITDPMIAGRLEALADDYDRRAEVASRAIDSSDVKPVRRRRAHVADHLDDEAGQ